MLFYIVLILVILLLTNAFGIKTNDKAGYILSSIFITGIASIRFDIGWDYMTYFELIDGSTNTGFMRFEPLSLLLALLAKLANNTFLFFTFSSCIIYPLAFYSFKKYSVSPTLSLIIYIGIFFLTSCSIVRQALAVSCSLYAYKYILKKSFIKYTLCILIATLFHYSAITALVIYPIYHYFKFKYLVYILFFLLICRSLLFSVMIRYGIYEEYLVALGDYDSGNLVKIFNLIIFLSFFLIIKKSGYNIIEKKTMSIILVGLFTPYLFGAALGERIGYYFLIYYCYLIPLLLQNKYIYKRYIYVCVFSLYFLTMIFYASNIEGQKSPYIPYKTIFNISRT